MASEEVQPEEATSTRQNGKVPTEDETSSLPSKTLIVDAIEWKRQWRMMEGKPPNAYADDLLLILARAYVAGVLKEEQ